MPERIEQLGAQPCVPDEAQPEVISILSRGAREFQTVRDKLLSGKINPTQAVNLGRSYAEQLIDNLAHYTEFPDARKG